MTAEEYQDRLMLAGQQHHKFLAGFQDLKLDLLNEIKQLEMPPNCIYWINEVDSFDFFNNIASFI